MLETIKQSLLLEFPAIIAAGMIWQLIVSLVMLWSTQTAPMRFSSGRGSEAADVFLADLHQEREPIINQKRLVGGSGRAILDDAGRGQIKC